MKYLPEDVHVGMKLRQRFGERDVSARGRDDRMEFSISPGELAICRKFAALVSGHFRGEPTQTVELLRDEPDCRFRRRRRLEQQAEFEQLFDSFPTLLGCRAVADQVRLENEPLGLDTARGLRRQARNER